MKTTRDLDSSHKLSDVTRASTERLNLKLVPVPLSTLIIPNDEPSNTLRKTWLD